MNIDATTPQVATSPRRGRFDDADGTHRLSARQLRTPHYTLAGKHYTEPGNPYTEGGTRLCSILTLRALSMVLTPFLAFLSNMASGNGHLMPSSWETVTSLMPSPFVTTAQLKSYFVITSLSTRWYS